MISASQSDDDAPRPRGFISTCKLTFDAAKKYGVVDIISHPFSYAELLIRIGYEPFRPIEERSIWTLYNPTLILPGVVPYARYLMFTDTPRVCRTFGPAFAEKLLTNQMMQCFSGECSPVTTDNEPPPERPYLLQRLTIENLQDFVETRAKQLAIQMGVTIVTHPIRVITVRYMASYVDQNPIFSDLWSCIVSSIKTQGIFTGLGPRLLADFIYGVAAATVYISIIEFLQKFDIHTLFMPNQLHFMDKMAVFLSDHVASGYSSQFHTISDFMIVNGSVLAVGNPPFMPVYDGWFDCWKNIRTDRLYKSVSLLKRDYQGPISWDTGHPVGLDHFGPTYPSTNSDVDVPFLLKDFYAPMLSRTN